LISNSIPSNDNELFLQPERRSSIESISTSDFFDESRRSSMISCGDINGDYEYDYTLFDDVPSLVADEPSQLSSYTSPCPSNSHEYNNVCVENAASFDIMMDGGVSPGNDSDVNQQHQFTDYFDFYPDYMQFDNSFDYNSLSSLMSSPNDQMMSCEPLATNIDA